MATNKVIVAAFETWNGGSSVSGLALGKEVASFIEANRGSFASLHTFTCERRAKKEFARAQRVAREWECRESNDWWEMQNALKKARSKRVRKAILKHGLI